MGPATPHEAWLEEVVRKLTYDGFTHRGGCSSRDCVCWIPHPICEEFMDDEPSAQWCARCGWDRKAHGE